ncbi:MAG: glutaredoxin family protein [Actinomycetes bacterium]
MPHVRRVRRRAAVLGHRQGEQGQAAAGREAERVLRLRRRRPQRLTFITRAGCTLCAQAEPAVRRLAGDAGVPVEVLDVDADPALRSDWGDHVPVVLLDGQEHARWFVDEAALRTALRGR